MFFVLTGFINLMLNVRICNEKFRSEYKLFDAPSPVGTLFPADQFIVHKIVHIASEHGLRTVHDQTTIRMRSHAALFAFLEWSTRGTKRAVPYADTNLSYLPSTFAPSADNKFRWEWFEIGLSAIRDMPSYEPFMISRFTVAYWNREYYNENRKKPWYSTL